MPARESADVRLAALREELAFVTAFYEKWTALTDFTIATFTQTVISREEIDRFDEMRNELNRLLPRIVSRVGNPIAIREQFGRAEQLGIFGFLLETVPHLGSFAKDILRRGDGYRERYFETVTAARAALEQALGRIERDIAAVDAGPSVIDSLTEQAQTASVTAFLDNLTDAEAHFASEAFDDSIHSARRTVERVATEVANVIATTPRRRRFRAAMDTLKDAGVVDEATHRSIVTPEVGFWGWSSEIGTHDEDDPDGEKFEAGSAEARLAIERARAIAEYLLSRLTEHLDAEEAENG